MRRSVASDFGMFCANPGIFEPRRGCKSTATHGNVSLEMVLHWGLLGQSAGVLGNTERVLLVPSGNFA